MLEFQEEARTSLHLMTTPVPRTNSRRQHTSAPAEVVSVPWLVKAVGGTLLVALICAYITLCVLFYQGQWQLVLHPSRSSSAPSTIQGAPYERVHFSPDESAVPQLTGWWIPAAPGARYPGITVLYLRGGDGSLADSVPELAELHTTGLNIFALDYRGYGQSASTHPTEERMSADAAAAWQYLTTSRKVSPSQIVLLGTGVGASLATGLVDLHPQSPALILEAPQGDLLDLAAKDPRAGLLPMRLLFRERFPLASPLAALKTPKLLVTVGSSTAPPVFVTAADPKSTVEFNTPSAPLYTQTLTRFLDQYLPPTRVPTLVPERNHLK